MDERELEWAERIVALEVKVQLVTDSNKKIEDKLDELLHLRSKGIGAFWLASGLLGTGILGTFFFVIDWIRGVHI